MHVTQARVCRMLIAVQKKATNYKYRERDVVGTVADDPLTGFKVAAL